MFKRRPDKGHSLKGVDGDSQSCRKRIECIGYTALRLRRLQPRGRDVRKRKVKFGGGCRTGTDSFLKQLGGAFGSGLIGPCEVVFTLRQEMIQKRCTHGAADAPCCFAEPSRAAASARRSA